MQWCATDRRCLKAIELIDIVAAVCKDFSCIATSPLFFIITKPDKTLQKHHILTLFKQLADNAARSLSAPDLLNEKDRLKQQMIMDFYCYLIKADNIIIIKPTDAGDSRTHALSFFHQSLSAQAEFNANAICFATAETSAVCREFNTKLAEQAQLGCEIIKKLQNGYNKIETLSWASSIEELSAILHNVPYPSSVFFNQQLDKEVDKILSLYENKDALQSNYQFITYFNQLHAFANPTIRVFLQQFSTIPEVINIYHSIKLTFFLYCNSHYQLDQIYIIGPMTDWQCRSDWQMAQVKPGLYVLNKCFFTEGQTFQHDFKYYCIPQRHTINQTQPYCLPGRNAASLNITSTKKRAHYVDFSYHCHESPMVSVVHDTNNWALVHKPIKLDKLVDADTRVLHHKAVPAAFNVFRFFNQAIIQQQLKQDDDVNNIQFKQYAQ